jgi:hypothetical protein
VQAWGPDYASHQPEKDYPTGLPKARRSEIRRQHMPVPGDLSALILLLYLDPFKLEVLDVMHPLHLGIGKTHLRRILIQGDQEWLDISYGNLAQHSESYISLKRKKTWRSSKRRGSAKRFSERGNGCGEKGGLCNRERTRCVGLACDYAPSGSLRKGTVHHTLEIRTISPTLAGSHRLFP